MSINILITGGAGFLCSEMALGLHRAGCKIALLDINLEGAKKIKNVIEVDGNQVMALEFDSRKKKDFESCLEEVLKVFGRVDILINGAGINAPTPFMEISEEEWDHI